MRITGTKTYDLLPIGNVRFTHIENVKDGRNPKFMWIGDITIMHETKVTCMNKSDLLTDGKRFYTTTGKSITQIAHDRFMEILEEEKVYVQEYFNI
jgi:hypothetical protein